MSKPLFSAAPADEASADVQRPLRKVIEPAAVTVAPVKLGQIGELVGLWLTIRLLTWLWAALVSPLRPQYPLESRVPLWPPSAPLGDWLQRVFVIPWLRRDAVIYVDIVGEGYRLDNGSAQFHPLLPWLAEIPNHWLDNPGLSLLIVSSLAALLLLIAFEQLALLDLSPEEARTATLALLFFPPAFVFFAPYTEGLFLLWAVLCLFWARQQRWWLAGLAGGLATLTRQQGILLVFPLLWELGAGSDWNLRRMLRGWRTWSATLLIPLGMVIWIVYRALALRDLQPDFSSIHNLIYSVVISPSSSKVVPVQTFWWPWRALWFAGRKVWVDFEYGLAIDLVLAVLFLLLLSLTWKRMRGSYQVYTGVIVLISFAYHTGPYYPYMGLPRHLLLAIPVFIGLGSVLQSGWQRLLLVGLGGVGIFFLLLQYVIEGWVP